MRPMMSGIRRILPVRRSIDRISASSIPAGPPTSTSSKVTRSGKMPILGSPRSDTSRPVQPAICSPMRVFSASRGRRTTMSRRTAATDQRGCRNEPSEALHSARHSSLVPAAVIDRNQRLPGLAHSRAYGNASRHSETGVRRPCPKAPLWTPDPQDARGAADHRLRRRSRAPQRPGARRLRRAARLVGRRSRRVLGPRLGFLRRHRREGRAAARRGQTRCATRASSPTARLNFAENLLRQTGRRHGDRLSRRGQGRAPPELGRAPRRSSRACSRRCRRKASASATASRRCFRTCRRRSRSCSPPPRSARPSPPARPTSASAACSTASARSRRSSSSPATAIGTTARRSRSRRS